jgi:DNA-binding NarL/FixJ family response regulator
MRVVLVGRADERARVRSELHAVGVEIAGEFETLAAARAANVDADATVLAEEGSDPFLRGLTPVEEPLTPRELEVLQLLAEGLPNKAIAEQLGISDQTVKFHVASISGKLGATNRTAVVRKALRRGLISV